MGIPDARAGFSGCPSDRTRALAGTRFTDVREHAEVDSTNRVAADMVRSGAGEGLVVVAGHQTAGRGRRGRSWEAPPGSSLLVSVVLHPSPALGYAALVTVACALAAADACSDTAGFNPGLKWPNDLVVGERKLAGILAEAPTGETTVVVGLGLNIRWRPPMPAHLAAIAITAEEAAGRMVDRRELLDAYLRRLDDRVARPAQAGGGGAMMDDYRRRCVTLGRPVRVELPGGRALAGDATGVGDDGSLEVTSATGMRRVTAGDVVHLRPG